MINPHPLDAKVLFDPAAHTYTVDGRILSSVSEVIKEFFPRFEGEKIARRIAMKGTNPKYRGMTAQGILRQWNAARDEAAFLGQKLHEQIFNYLTDGLMSESQEFVWWKNWHNTVSEHYGKPARLEWRIFDERAGIAGTLDALFQDDRGQYHLLDWKRKKKLGGPAYEYGLGPLSRLPATDFHKGSIQLNLYRALLERNYGINIANMALVQIHPEIGGCRVHAVEQMDRETKAILNACQNRTK